MMEFSSMPVSGGHLEAFLIGAAIILPPFIVLIQRRRRRRLRFSMKTALIMLTIIPFLIWWSLPDLLGMLDGDFRVDWLAYIRGFIVPLSISWIYTWALLRPRHDCVPKEKP